MAHDCKMTFAANTRSATRINSIIRFYSIKTPNIEELDRYFGNITYLSSIGIQIALPRIISDLNH